MGKAEGESTMTKSRDERYAEIIEKLDQAASQAASFATGQSYVQTEPAKKKPNVTFVIVQELFSKLGPKSRNDARLRDSRWERRGPRLLNSAVAIAITAWTAFVCSADLVQRY